MKAYSKASPCISFLKERTLLTGVTSSKKTYHLVLDTTNWEGSYKVGDSIGILPSNNPEEVDRILQVIRASGNEEVFDKRAEETVSLRLFLTNRANLARVGRSYLALLTEKGVVLPEEQSLTLEEWLRKHPLTPEEIAAKVMPLLPRFYSIANSKLVFPNEIHLVVGYLQYHLEGQTRVGVGSRFLCDLVEIEKTQIPWYVQPSNHFALPEDPNQSIVMIGAGTGIAPYRAFLQERMATQAAGNNWLFFGERNVATDFYYGPFWKALEAQGRLRLNVAFSRDGATKTYVQHQMYEQRKSLWSYLQDKAIIYVCGDANEMAKDVDATLHRIIKEEGNYSEEDAIHYVKTMRKDGRYRVDVY
jgi:sulfite reductase (NADPH) flavoprotein alpha-component